MGPKFKNHTDSINLRLKYLTGFIFFIFVIVASNFFYLQIIRKDFYKKIKENQYYLAKILEPERGEIFIQDKFKELYPLAINKEWPILYIVPKNIKDPNKLINQLSEILNIDNKKLKSKIKKKNSFYEVIAKKLDNKTFEKLKSLKSKNLHFDKEKGRIYPNNSLMAHVVGFLGKRNTESIGQYGIEGYYEKELKGKKGKFLGKKDAQGHWIALGQTKIIPPINGSDLILTIDKNIQFIAENKLKEAIEKWNADSGSVIIMETKTGRILAMASYPNFNPNEYYKVRNYNIFKNQTIQEIFEPGSIFKPIVMAAAIDSGKITPETKFYDKGFVKVENRIIKTFDQKHRGWQTMSDVIEKSLNTGMVFVAQKLGKKLFKEYIKKFHLDKKTNIDLSGEIKGDISNLNKTKEIYFATASFGQGISVTPIQIVTAINAIANKGLIMKPYVVDKIIKKDKEVEIIKPVNLGQAIKKDTAIKIIKMMINAVEKGYGKRAGVEGYLVAGKTGTAQIPNSDKKGYSNKFIHSFIGFAPALDPKFTAFIKIDNPKGIRFAADSLSSIFGELAKYILNYYEIKPDIIK